MGHPHPRYSHRLEKYMQLICSLSDDGRALTNFSAPCYKSGQRTGETMAFPTGFKMVWTMASSGPSGLEDIFMLAFR